MHRLGSALRAMFFSMIVVLGMVAPGSGAEIFPRYKVIEPNVAFWITVYSQYTTSQAIIHDSTDLGVVYEVISVKPYDAPGARKINRDRMKRANAKYEAILRRLADDPHCKDKDCQRVVRLFGPKADAATFRRASRRVRSQIGQKDRFQAGVIRSGAYLDQIRSILKSYGVPEDLAYLPHVESSFNPGAYSKFGAAGIWQFTRSTGRRFMAVDYVLDERRDPIRATHAAAQLLKENYDKLGSWPLAITAYNHGAAGMARARQKHGDYPAIFADYRSRTFKFASRNFYSEFLAARQVASDHTSYFGPLSLDAPTPSHTVTLKGYVRFEDLCAHYNVVPDVVQEMNPALRPPVFSDQKYVPQGYQLRLPLEIAARGPSLEDIPPSLLKSAQRPSRFYTVQRGDTAGNIARRHGVRLSDLILANNLNTRATIYPRQTLRIPLPGEKVTPVEPQAPVIVATEAPLLVAALDQETAENVESSVNDGASTEPPEPEAVEPELEREQTVLAPAPEVVPKPPVTSAPITAEAEEPQATEAPAPEPLQESQMAPVPLPEEIQAPPTTAAPISAEAQEPPVTTEPMPEVVAEARTEPTPIPEEAPEVPELQASASEEARESQASATITPEEVQEPERAATPAPEATTEQQAGFVSPAPVKEEPQAIPTTVMPNTEIVSIEVGFDRVTKINQRPVGILQVEVEETLGHYAEWAGVRTQQIRRLNGLRFGRTLHLHQKIKIPLDKIDATAFEEQRYEYHKRLQEDFFAVYRVGELEPYRVEQGDNYWALCREKFGVPMWLLKHYNMDVDLADLHINQKLMIPVILETTAGDPGTVTNDTASEADAAGSSEDEPETAPSEDAPGR